MSEDKPIIRNRISNIDVNVKSGYSPTIARWGLKSQVRLDKGERMRDKLAACFAGVKAMLSAQIPGIKINAPEVFPINNKQCVVLITGWKSETILVS